jgi:hypothetical protein
MTADARFEDAGERPLRLRAESPEDLAVISALIQDAVTRSSDVSWMPRRRRFSILINRFRWEDAAQASADARRYERVRALLSVDNALRARASGLAPARGDVVICLLAADWQPGEDGTGTLLLTLAGGGAIAIDVECLDVTLIDVSRPYLAQAGRLPVHPVE